MYTQWFEVCTSCLKASLVIVMCCMYLGTNILEAGQAYALPPKELEKALN
jgi:hypothetical protein